MSTDKKLHEGHRQRGRARFLVEGLDALEDHQVFELNQRYLFNYCSARLKCMTYFGLFDESELLTRYPLAVFSLDSPIPT